MKLLYCVLILSIVSGDPAQAETLDWKAGAAKIIITPTEPMYLAGFVSREVPAEGTAMDLYAKSLAIEDRNGTRFVMVTLDLVEVTYQLRDDVVAAAREQFGLAPESLLLHCSHTHCGPELRYTELEFMKFTDPLSKERCLRYNEFLKEKIIAVIGEAIEGLAPATISYGNDSCGFAMNRRLKSDKPTGNPYLNSPNPEAVVDHDVPVLTVREADETLSAVVFGYACHNTSMNISEWHGDYAGHAQGMIEEAHPGTVALFMMGCGGDQNAYPRFGPILLLGICFFIPSASLSPLGRGRRGFNGIGRKFFGIGPVLSVRKSVIHKTSVTRQGRIFVGSFIPLDRIGNDTGLCRCDGCFGQCDNTREIRSSREFAQ